jgi:hypothetical protein
MSRESRESELGDAEADWRERRDLFSIPKDGGLLGPVMLEVHNEKREG